MNKVYSRMTLTQLLREKDEITKDAAMPTQQKKQILQTIEDQIKSKESRSFFKKREA